MPGTNAGTRGAREFDGIIAAVHEDEIYYHRDQCDMITMKLRLAAKAGLEIRTWAANDARGGLQPADWRLRNPSHRSSLPLGEGAVLLLQCSRGPLSF